MIPNFHVKDIIKEREGNKKIKPLPDADAIKKIDSDMPCCIVDADDEIIAIVLPNLLGKKKGVKVHPQRDIKFDWLHLI